MADAPVKVVVKNSKVVEAKSGRVVNPDLPDTAQAPVGSDITFEMYCSVQSIPVTSRAGMRAFTKTHTATVEKWDEIFKSY